MFRAVGDRSKELDLDERKKMGEPNRLTSSRLGRDQRRQLTQPALHGFFGVAEAWDLTIEEQLRLLAIDSRPTLARWRRGQIKTLNLQTLERISYVLGIYHGINTLLPIPGRARGWMRHPNRAPLFGGQSALDRMLSGRVDDLSAVRRYVDSQIANS